jgi:hypothetical protein
MHYGVIAIFAAVVVVFAWIVLEAKIKFRRRSRAISNAVTCLPDDSGTKERPARYRAPPPCTNIQQRV